MKARMDDDDSIALPVRKRRSTWNLKIVYRIRP
jgi:hypothetical protein